MLDPVRTVGHTPQSPRPLSLGVIGDSISYGAWSSLTWHDLLHGMARNLPGIGPLTIANHAISGTSSVDWAAAIAGYALTAHDRVLVLFGTKDVQAQVTRAPFRATLATIAPALVTAGAGPEGRANGG